VDEVILLGDIVERCLASTSQIITHTNAFVQTLGSAARIRRATYLIGNHEYAIWTDYLSRRMRLAPREHSRANSEDHSQVDPGRPPTPTITGPQGEMIVEHGKRCDVNGAAEDILSIFFGYPFGSSWRSIQRQGTLDFAIANPVYAREFFGSSYIRNMILLCSTSYVDLNIFKDHTLDGGCICHHLESVESS